MTIAYEKPSRLANWNRPLQYLTPDSSCDEEKK